MGFCRESRSPLPSVYTSHPTRLRYGKWYGNEWGGMGGSNLLGSTWNFSRIASISKAAGMEEPTNGLNILVSWKGIQRLKKEMCLITNYLEDHPRTCKWLGSPPFYKPWKGHLEGKQPYLGNLPITVINYHLLIELILQVWFNGTSPVGFEPTPPLAPIEKLPVNPKAKHFC